MYVNRTDIVISNDNLHRAIFTDLGVPVLTVGESTQFLDLGGIINFVFQDTQLRFEINQDAAEQAKLVISSKLMRLAKSVRKGGQK